MKQTEVIIGLTGEVSGSVNVGLFKYESQGKHRGLIRTVELSSPVAQDDRDYALLIGFLLLTGWRLSVIEIEIDPLKPLLHSHPSQTQLGVMLLPPIGFTDQSQIRIIPLRIVKLADSQSLCCTLRLWKLPF
jgi:hypothetical protein